MLIASDRGRVDDFVQKVLHNAAQYQDALRTTGQVSTQQQDECSPHEWDYSAPKIRFTCSRVVNMKPPPCVSMKCSECG